MGYAVTWRQSTGGRVNRSQSFKTERGAEAFADRLFARLDTHAIAVHYPDRIVHRTRWQEA